MVPLLKAYRAALQLACDPPASLALPKRLDRLHRRLRPTFGCQFFATRHVRRRTAALERALAARTAVGEADENDQLELEAVRSFKASLTPPPSRGWAVAGLIAAILLTQALVGGLVEDSRSGTSSTAGSPSTTEHIRASFNGLSLSPDVQSIGDLARALLSANVEDLCGFILSILCVFYVFGRPLATGHRLAQLCLARPGRLGRRRRDSPLCREAGQLDIAAQEAAITRIASAEFPRDAQVDLLVKAAPVLALVAVGLLVGRLGFGLFSIESGAWLAGCVGLLCLLGWLPGRTRGFQGRRWTVVCWLVGLTGFALLTSWLMIGQVEDPSAADALVVYALVAITGGGLGRLGWLTRQMIGCGHTPMWILVPVGLVIATLVIAPVGTFPAINDRQVAVRTAGLQDLPQIDRADLQVMLASRPQLAGADLRTQDLHGLWLRDSHLAGAQLALADLRRVDLQRSALANADLHGTRAVGARLLDADLRAANFRCADLAGADLRGAKLNGATFEDTIASSRTRWPAGFDLRGITSRGAALREMGESEFSFDTWLSFCLSSVP